MAHSYSIEQKDDHEKYKSIYSANAEEFAMFERMSRCVTLLHSTPCQLYVPCG